MMNCGPGSRQEITKISRMMPDEIPKRRARPEHTPAIHRSSRGRYNLSTALPPPRPRVRVTRTLLASAVNVGPDSRPIPGRVAQWRGGHGGDAPVTVALLLASTGNALDPTDATRLADDLTAALVAAG